MKHLLITALLAVVAMAGCTKERLETDSVEYTIECVECLVKFTAEDGLDRTHGVKGKQRFVFPASNIDTAVLSVYVGKLLTFEQEVTLTIRSGKRKVTQSEHLGYRGVGIDSFTISMGL